MVNVGAVNDAESTVLDDEAFVKMALGTQQSRRDNRSFVHSKVGSNHAKFRNRYIGATVASRVSEADRAAGQRLSHQQKSSSVQDGVQRSLHRLQPRQSAAVMLYEMKIHRSHIGRLPEPRNEPGYHGESQGAGVEEESDRFSVMSIASTSSRCISEASTRILKEPLSRSMWMPLSATSSMRKVRGPGMLHVAGNEDDLPLRDTYQEQPKKAQVTEENNRDISVKREVQQCSDVLELRRYVKSHSEVIPQIEFAGTQGDLPDHVLLKKPSSLNISERKSIFDKIHKLEREANADGADKEESKSESYTPVPIPPEYQGRSKGLHKSPEIVERFDRLKELSKYAECAFTCPK